MLSNAGLEITKAVLKVFHKDVYTKFPTAFRLGSQLCREEQKWAGSFISELIVTLPLLLRVGLRTLQRIRERKDLTMSIVYDPGSKRKAAESSNDIFIRPVTPGLLAASLVQFDSSIAFL